MSTDVRPTTGQAPADGCDEAPAATGARAADKSAFRESPQTLIQESIKYRRRAQEAERRAEALEAEIEELRQARDERASAIDADLAQAKAETEALRLRLETVEHDRHLEHELVRAGCADTETALALSRERLGGNPPPEDLAAFARSLLEEKPHLRGETGNIPAHGSRGSRGLPPRTAAVKPAGDSAPRRATERLATEARRTGNPRDLMAYMRVRRSGGAL